jgi:hypothetical protein
MHKLAKIQNINRPKVGRVYSGTGASINHSNSNSDSTVTISTNGSTDVGWYAQSNTTPINPPSTPYFAYNMNLADFQYYTSFYSDTTVVFDDSIPSVLVGSINTQLTNISPLKIKFAICTVTGSNITFPITSMAVDANGAPIRITSTYIFMNLDSNNLTSMVRTSIAFTANSPGVTIPQNTTITAPVNQGVQGALTNANFMGIRCTSLSSSSLTLTFYTNATVNWSTETIMNNLYMGAIGDTTFVNFYTNATDGVLTSAGTDERVSAFSTTAPTDATLYPLVGQIWIGYNDSITSMELLGSSLLPINIVINPTGYGKIMVVNRYTSKFVITVTVNNTPITSSDGTTYLLAPPLVEES